MAAPHGSDWLGHMKNFQIYLLAVICTCAGLGLAAYKWQVLGVPIERSAEAEVWTVEARIGFRGRNSGNKVRLQIPSNPPGFAILSEYYVSRGYGKTEESDRTGRRVEWTRRRAAGAQALYYRLTVYRDDQPQAREASVPLPVRIEFEEPMNTAMNSVIEQVRAQSADIGTFAGQLLARLNDPSPSEEVALLRKDHRGALDKAQLAVRLLGTGANISARVIQVLELKPDTTMAQLRPWIQVHNGTRWLNFNPDAPIEGLPRNVLIWSYSADPVLEVDGSSNATLHFASASNTVEALAVARDRAETLQSAAIRYSLFDLPVATRSVYQVLLLVPIGAFVMLILRNFIGIKTFGTFMPVLIALAFRETQLLGGILLFTVVVGLGLLVRFYMEQLKLLLVPRLTAVLIVTVLLMCAVTVLSHHMDVEIGLSVGLFPMVIMAMTIERMSIAWDERGPGAAIKDAIGSLIVAAIAYLVMTHPKVEYMVFAFPELLLVLLALTVLAGRYSGYRLTELSRFKALARGLK